MNTITLTANTSMGIFSLIDSKTVFNVPGPP